MQNVYDIARDLSASLKETDQYKDYSRLKKQVDANPQMKKMLDDIQQKSMALQAQMMSGAEQDQELLSQLQNLSQIVMSDPLAGAYIQAQFQLSQIITDLCGIIGEVLR